MADYAFTIIYCGEKSGKKAERTLDVIATSKFDRDLWIKTIKSLMKMPFDQRVALSGNIVDNLSIFITEFLISPFFDISVPSNQKETDSAFQESVHYGIYHTLGLAKGLVIENARANIEKFLDSTSKSNNKVRESVYFIF